MTRHAFAAAALVAATLLASEVYVHHVTVSRELAAAAHSRDLQAQSSSVTPTPAPPEDGVRSSQRPQSDRTLATATPGPTGPDGAAPESDDDDEDESSSSVLPEGLRKVFTGDFDTGNFSQWETCQSVFTNGDCDEYRSQHYSMEIVPGRRGGSRAAKFVVRPGDVPDFGGGERSEVAGHSSGAKTREGDERWYRFALRFGKDFPRPAEGSWFIVMQWHSGNGSPPLAIEVSPDREVYVGGEAAAGRRALGPVRAGQWVDYVLHVGFSSGSRGFVEGWENGVRTVPRHSRPTMSSSENYLKMGIYRGNDDSTTAEVSIDDVQVSAP